MEPCLISGERVGLSKILPSVRSLKSKTNLVIIITMMMIMIIMIMMITMMMMLLMMISWIAQEQGQRVGIPLEGGTNEKSTLYFDEMSLYFDGI